MRTHTHTLIMLALASCGAMLAGCSRSGEGETAKDKQALSPEEQKYVAAAEPFVKAVAARAYADAYAQLSSHARARMSLNQFVPAPNDAQYARNEAQPRPNVSAGDFATLMALVEKEHGQPAAVKNIHVFETDPTVLAGRGEKLDVLFSIGAMPPSIPVDIRRASLRCQIRTTLSPEQLKQAAKDLHTTPEELQKSDDFEPYFNLKLVLVEEAGALRVGYFEFLPPSMLD